MLGEEFISALARKVSGARLGIAADVAEGQQQQQQPQQQLRVAGPILPDETKVAVLTTAAVLLGLQATGVAALMSAAPCTRRPEDGAPESVS